MSDAFRSGQESMRKRAVALCAELADRAGIACIMASGPEKEQHLFASLAATDLQTQIEALPLEEAP